ncbi:MAG: nucleotide exchange factor GrpE [Verrucomicrobiae bacterium]|nr:nucleotide exchange factor GrpE [Verrucomicrobiae bacterium]
MRDTTDLKVPKWPFFLGDGFMLGLAYFVFAQGQGPLQQWEITALVICVGLGALLGVVPFLLEYRATLKLIEVSAVGTALDKIQQLETVAAQISGATNHWQYAQEQADKTATLAREMSERMAGEVRDFTEFMQRINDGEKSTLRLEVEKMRRAENDWLNVAIHILDHIYALVHAAERSGQPNLIAQLQQFQNACRDVARRVGLVPFVPETGTPFNPERHQGTEDRPPPAGARVAEVLAAGYTFQGRLLRQALVRVQIDAAPPAEDTEPGTSGTHVEKSADQDQLPLEPESANPA